MSTRDTIARDFRSYRHGLVLGLTLAEVMLLLVFALLISFVAIWKFERDKRLKLEALSTSSASSATKQLTSDIIAELAEAAQIDSARVLEAIKQIKNGKELEALDKAEKQFIAEERRQFSRQTAKAIDDNWKALTRALGNSADLQERLDIADLVKRSPELLKKGEHDWPPIIKLREADGYYFAKGSAELRSEFQQKLKDEVAPQLVSTAKKFRVDVIEVIGHTDEQAIVQRYSNLDKQLLDVTKGAGAIGTLLPADNAGLGLARAVSVVQALMADSELKQFRILPLSGGQLIDTDDSIARGAGGDVKERRRIEIRLRRSDTSPGKVTDTSQGGSTSR